MIEKLAERKQKELDAMQGKTRTPPVKSGTNMVSDTELFARMGKSAKVIKHGN